MMLNSLATTTAIWRPLLPQLTQFHSVVCIDYPGHGNSPSRALPDDFDALAAQILGIADVLGIERAHLVGASVGGMLSLALAAQWPERVRSISVVGSSPRMEQQMWVDRGDLVRDFGVEGIVADVLPRWFTEQFARHRPDVVAEYRDMLVRTTDASYLAFCELLAGLDVRPKLSAIKCPTLVVSGGMDTATTVDEARDVVAVVPESRLEILPDAAHMIQAMHPVLLGRLLREHIHKAE